MEDKLINEAFSEMKKGLPKIGECPDEADLVCFAEGIMDEKKTERIEKHLISCSKCCDYVVSLNKVINFPAEERLPEVPTEQLRKVSALVKDREKDILSNLERITQFIKEFFSFDWIAQPIPVAVKSGAVVFLVLLIVSTTFLYRQQREPLSLQMEVIGKTRVITTRGTPGEEIVEKIIKEGDTLYSNGYCRINFELDQDGYAYVLLYDSTNKLHQLYPDYDTAILQKVKAKTKYTIPEGEDNWFRLDDYIGTETVFILASSKPISGLRETFADLQGLSREEVVKTLKSKARVVKVLSFKHQ